MAEKTFLGKTFKFGGKIGNLSPNLGNYYGVYIFVLPDDFEKVEFNVCSNLKKWKKYTVSVPIEQLQNKWVKNAKILYIGRSTSITMQKCALKHLAFWNGKNVSAYGGRVIGQLKNFEDLEVWYLECDEPAQVKNALLNSFKNTYGKLPFANWD